MKIIIILGFISLYSGLQAQRTAEWLGGTPGRESVWEEARNWSHNRLPDEWTYVVIKERNNGHHSQPIIRTAVCVAALEIFPGASLSIETSGDLTIDGTYVFSPGFINHGGTLRTDKSIRSINTDKLLSENTEPSFVSIKDLSSFPAYRDERCALKEANRNH